MRYIDNPDLTPDELETFRSAVNVWRKSQVVVIAGKLTGETDEVQWTRRIAGEYPQLKPDLIRLIDKDNPCLSFYAILTLYWIDPETIDEFIKRSDRKYPVQLGSFCFRRELSNTLHDLLSYLEIQSANKTA